MFPKPVAMLRAAKWVIIVVTITRDTVTIYVKHIVVTRLRFVQSRIVPEFLSMVVQEEQDHLGLLAPVSIEVASRQ